MSDRAPTLPDFANPPLIEVALSVQFAPLAGLTAPYLGLAWLEFREGFPRVEEHPALDPIVERFGEPAPPPAEVGFRLMDKPETRFWFLNTAGSELIQLQKDRVIHNWRKVGDGDVYPRYERIRDTFRSELERFEGFLKRESLGDFLPTQCEVTYVNHIVPGGEWQRPGQADRLFSLWSRPPGEFLPEPDDVRFAIRYRIPDAGGNPVGRLHVSMQPAYSKKDEKIIAVLNLTARGLAEGQGIQGAIGFLDKGREWIVRAFASVTSTQMHKAWGRRDGH